MNRFISALTVAALIGLSVGFPAPVIADPPLKAGLYLPEPFQRLGMTPAFEPPLIKGITVFPQHPLQFDFIATPGQSKGKDTFDREIRKMINYFFGALTVPKDDLWVNLSPFEKDRIIPANLGATEMGRDLLGQDYVLKQLIASLMDPDTAIGKKFWDTVYTRARSRFGTTNIPVDTLNKVWIVPDRAVVHQQWPSAFVTDSHLKVMLEQDYVAAQQNRRGERAERAGPVKATEVSRLTQSIIREVLLPEVEREVNTGSHFAPLRQIYTALILAEWYKRSLKGSPLSRAYVNQNKIKGIDLKDKSLKDSIYQRYLKAYRHGMYNLVKEDYDAFTRQLTPRKYFAGGISLGDTAAKIDAAMRVETGEELLGPGAETIRVAADPMRVRPESPQDFVLQMGHADVQNQVWFGKDNSVAHFVAFPGHNGTVNFYGNIPTGDKVFSLQVQQGASGSLAGFSPSVELNADVLDRPELIRHPNDPKLRGSGFLFKVHPRGPATAFVISKVLFGNGKSVREYERSGPGDPTAKENTDKYADGGKDIMAKSWKKIGVNDRIVMEAVNQPRITDQPHDEHNYVLRLAFPPGVDVTVDDQNNLIVHPAQQGDVIIQANLYSDHLPIRHLALEDLYTPDILRQLIDLQHAEQGWFPEGTQAADSEEFRNAVIELLENQGSERETAARQAHIRQQGQALKLDADKLDMALHPALHYQTLPFFALENMTRLLRTGQYLIADNLPMMAGSPYYTTVFPPDVFIVMPELLDFLKPEVARNQFYALLRMEHDSQFAHELDIRQSSRSAFVALRHKMIRADTDLLGLLYISTMIKHAGKYGINWNDKIRGEETVGDIVKKVAGYVLAKAEALRDPGDISHFMGSKVEDDPRGTWRDGASSTFHGKYMYGLVFLMAPAVAAIKDMNARHRFINRDVNFDALIETWRAARQRFEFTQNRTERIEGLMSWYAWKIDKDGMAYIRALVEDAKKYYGITYTFDTSGPDAFLKSIRHFLETYMPHKDFTGHAIALDKKGALIKVDDTDALMFSLSSIDRVAMDDLKAGMSSEFLHVAFGGTGTTNGELLTGVPTVVGEDRYIKNPVGLPKAMEAQGRPGVADLYKTHENNYHTIKWIAMEYKKLNGLLEQVNAHTDTDGEVSQDTRNLLLAVLVRLDELDRLNQQVTEETLEPFVNGAGEIAWRPYGSADALLADDAPEKTGIRSGGVQGFNLMALPPPVHLNKMSAKMPGLLVAQLRAYVSHNPAAARNWVNQWLGQAPVKLDTDMIRAPLEDLGGIDLNTDLLNLKIEGAENRATPSSSSTDNPLMNIEGLVPRIIHEEPFKPAVASPA